MNKFNYSSKNLGQLDNGSADLFIRSLRIADLDPNVVVHTNSTNRLVAVNDVETDNEVVFKPDTFDADYKSVGFNNGIKSTDIVVSGDEKQVATKPSNTDKSYAYGEAVFDTSHHDYEVKVELKATPSGSDHRLVFCTTPYTTLASVLNLGDWGTSCIMFKLHDTGIQHVFANDSVTGSNCWSYTYTNSGVSIGDTFDFKITNGVLKLYYNDSLISGVPDFPIAVGERFYIGIVDRDTSTGAFSVEAMYKIKSRTHKLKTESGKMKITDSNNKELMTVSETKFHTSVKQSHMDSFRQTFNTTDNTELLNKKYQYVVLDTTANSAFCTLNLPELKEITHSYMLYLFRVSTNQEIRIYPSGTDNIDGVNSSGGYLSMGQNWSSLQLLASIEEDGKNKQWLLHSELESKLYDSYQKGIIANTSFTNSWDSTTGATFKNINSGFDMSFTALSSKYEFIFNTYIDDGNGGSTYSFYFDIYNVDTSAYDITPHAVLVAKFDENDEMAKVVKMYGLSLNVGQTYNIQIHGRASTTGQLFTIRSGSGAYPNNSLFIRPLYNTTVF